MPFTWPSILILKGNRVQNKAKLIKFPIQTSLDPRPTNPRNCRAWFTNFAIKSHMVGVCILVARARPCRRYTELAEVS